MYAIGDFGSYTTPILMLHDMDAAFRFMRLWIKWENKLFSLHPPTPTPPALSLFWNRFGNFVSKWHIPYWHNSEQLEKFNFPTNKFAFISFYFVPVCPSGSLPLSVSLLIKIIIIYINQHNIGWRQAITQCHCRRLTVGNLLSILSHEILLVFGWKLECVRLAVWARLFFTFSSIEHPTRFPPLCIWTFRPIHNTFQWYNSRYSITSHPPSQMGWMRANGRESEWKSKYVKLIFRYFHIKESRPVNKIFHCLSASSKQKWERGRRGVELQKKKKGWETADGRRPALIGRCGTCTSFILYVPNAVFIGEWMGRVLMTLCRRLLVAGGEANLLLALKNKITIHFQRFLHCHTFTAFSSFHSVVPR